MFVFCIEQFSSYSKRTQWNSFAIKIQFSFILCFGKIYRKNNMYFFIVFFSICVPHARASGNLRVCVCFYNSNVFVGIRERGSYTRAHIPQIENQNIPQLRIYEQCNNIIVIAHRDGDGRTNEYNAQPQHQQQATS